MHENKIILQKHSATISISNKITMEQRKIFNVLLHIGKEQINSEQGGKNKFQIELTEIKRHLTDNKQNNKFIKDSLFGLMDIKVEFNILQKDKSIDWIAFVLLSDARIKNSKVYFSFSQTIFETLENPSIFALLDLNIIKGLTSKYSITLYELLEDYKNTSIPKLSIEQLNKLMGTENKYLNFSLLRKYVIEPAVREINEKTDFKIEWEEFKSGRKITDIKFNHKQTTIEINEELNELKNKFIGKTFTVITKNALGGYSELKYILDGIEQGSQKYLYKIFLLDSTMNRVQGKTENTAEQISNLAYI